MLSALEQVAGREDRRGSSAERLGRRLRLLYWVVVVVVLGAGAFGLAARWQASMPLMMIGLAWLSCGLAWWVAQWLDTRDLERSLSYHPVPRRAVPWRVLAAGWMVLAVWFSFHTAAITVAGLGDDYMLGDAAVVLGNKINPDGRPHPRLQSRLDRARELYQAGVVRLILVSGGKGEEGFEEAEVMRDALIRDGVPAERILVDRQGTTTFDSAVGAQALLAQKGLRSVVLVSQYYHLARARLAFARAGFGPVSIAHAPFGPELHEPWSLVREFLGYYFYRVRPFPAPEPR
jgi:vancomycin permeability regulator SanA